MGSYRHLSFEEREELSRGLAAGHSLRRIARQIGRAPSTLSREVRRNMVWRTYRAWSANRVASERARRRGIRRLADPWLWQYVRSKLLEGWSPEQISHRLRVDYPDDPTKRVSAETIYATLYLTPRGELRRVLRRGRDRRKHRRVSSGQGKLRNMVSIHERPPEVSTRQVPGHWEGDLIADGRTKEAIGVLVERTSRYVVLVKLETKTAKDVERGFARKLRRVPATLRKSLTYDQGKEMANHESLAKKVSIKIYFADPASPWQRPTCENTNGLIRQYFPKSTNFTDVTQRDLNFVAQRLNTRPRKGLEWATPLEVYEALARAPS
jgi:IS30 family transposase